jgi:RND family efflux transporter MFP subunit
MFRFPFLTILALFLVWIASPFSSVAEEVFVVKIADQADEKSVFATVESLDVIPARTRVSGMVAELKVSEGDRVEAGQVLALISDDKNALRIRSINAQIAAASAEKTNADTELTRARDLFDRGIIPKTRLDAAIARADVANGQVRSLSANRNVVSQTVREGQVLSPTAGRVLNVPVTAGTVVLPGEAIAMIAAENYVLRLQLPERHARYIKPGGKVRVDASLVDGQNSAVGEIIRVYPQIREGKVIADANVPGLGDFFVGERVRVWVPVQAHKTILIPTKFVSNRFGVDLVTLRRENGKSSEIVVQRGRTIGDKVEILAGLHAGDEVIAP